VIELTCAKKGTSATANHDYLVWGGRGCRLGCLGLLLAVSDGGQGHVAVVSNGRRSLWRDAPIAMPSRTFQISWGTAPSLWKTAHTSSGTARTTCGPFWTSFLPAQTSPGKRTSSQGLWIGAKRYRPERRPKRPERRLGRFGRRSGRPKAQFRRPGRLLKWPGWVPSRRQWRCWRAGQDAIPLADSSCCWLWWCTKKKTPQRLARTSPCGVWFRLLVKIRHRISGLDDGSLHLS